MDQISNLKIVRLSDFKQLEDASKCGLVQLYQKIFADPPYFEKFSDDDVKEIFITYATEGILFLAYLTDEVIGFGAALPFSKSSIAYLEKELKVPSNSTWYMADVGVRHDFRRHGLARQLVQARLDAFSSGDTVVMRTSEANIASQSLYRSLGFQLLPVTEDTSQCRQDGTIQTDKRIFMVKVV